MSYASPFSQIFFHSFWLNLSNFESSPQNNLQANIDFKCYNLCFNRECVQCRAFNKGEKKDTCAQECSRFNITKVENRDKLPQPGQVDPLSHCKEKDVDDCWFYFTYSVNANGDAIVHVVETPGRNLIISKCFSFSSLSCFYYLGLFP